MIFTLKKKFLKQLQVSTFPRKYKASLMHWKEVLPLEGWVCNYLLHSCFLLKQLLLAGWRCFVGQAVAWAWLGMATLVLLNIRSGSSEINYCALGGTSYPSHETESHCAWGCTNTSHFCSILLFNAAKETVKGKKKKPGSTQGPEC